MNNILRNTDICKIDLSNKLYTLDPQSHPLFSLLKSAKKDREICNPIFTSNSIKNSARILRRNICVEGDHIDSMYLRLRELREYAIDIEKILWFEDVFPDPYSDKSQDLIPNAYDRAGYRTTRGVFKSYKLGVHVDSSISLHEERFYDFLREGFTYGSSEKYLFVDIISYDKIQKFNLILEEVKLFDSVDALRNVSPFGICNIIKNPVFSKGTLALLDLESVKYVHFRNRDTYLRTNVQYRFEDCDISEEEIDRLTKNEKRVDMVITEFGLDFNSPYKNLIQLVK